MQNFRESAKTLSEKTKKPRYKKPVLPDTRAIEDEETKRLTVMWDALLVSGEAIPKAELQRVHGVPDMGWDEFFTKHFENPEGRIFGESFFVWLSGAMACLKTVDKEIGQDNVETVLGASGARYEIHRSDQRFGNQQQFADTGDPFLQEMLEGKG